MRGRGVLRAGRRDRAFRYGIFVEARPAVDTERSVIEQQSEGFRANLERIGIPHVVTTGLVIWPSVAIRLRATAIFEQTPGPAAGALVSSRP